MASPPCQKQACDIQDCLSSNNYQESRCTSVIENLYKCCAKMYEASGTSTACPKTEVVTRKLEEQKKRAAGKA